MVSLTSIALASPRVLQNPRPVSLRPRTLRAGDCCPSPAGVATSGARFGNTHRNLAQICVLVWALRRGSRIDARPWQLAPPRLFPPDSHDQTQSTVQSTPRQRLRISGCARDGRSRQRPVAAAGRKGREFRALSDQNPKHTGAQSRNREWQVPPLSSANQLRQRFPRGTRTTDPAARTRGRRTLLQLRGRRGLRASVDSHRRPHFRNARPPLDCPIASS